MKIAIIAAMSKELALLLPLIENPSTVSVNGTVFHTGRMCGHDVIALQSGIGKVNAAIGALTLIENFHPALVINTGVAGGTHEGTILDVVIPDGVAYHDVWCGPGTEPGDAAGCPRFFATSPSILALKAVQPRQGVKRGLIASGDIFVSRPEEVEHIKGLYPDALAIDMESAAIAQVCYLKSVPFACLRVISDTPGAAENISQYENFWEDAPRHTFTLLREVIGQL